MTNQGLIEATSSAVGDELTKLFGFASTRLTQVANTETEVQSGINSLNYDGAVTIHLTVGTFDPAIATPMRLRILSGAAQGLEAIIATRDSTTQCTLSVALPGAALFTGASWQIVRDADAVLHVENTLDFAPANSPGRVVVDGQIYNYAGMTSTTFTGLTRDDGTGLIVNGVAKTHALLTIVSDYSRALSAIDRYRRAFLLAYAQGTDLNILGRNLGVARPVELLDDEIYRKLIPAIAYSPRGTIFAMEQVLDVLLGEESLGSGNYTASGSGDPYHVTLVSGTFPTNIVGMRFRVTTGYQAGRTIRIASRNSATDITLNAPMDAFTLQSWEITEPNWEIFEDLTLGSLNHGCTVFFRRTDQTLPQNPNGKAFLDGEETVPLASSSTLDYSGRARLRTCSVKLRDEGGAQVVAKSDSTHQASSTNGIAITGPAGTFPTAVMIGDYFQVLSGPAAGRIGVVLSRTNATAITLGFPGSGSSADPSEDGSGTIGEAFAASQWQVLRSKSNVMYYLPSAEVRIEYEGDTGSNTWTWAGRLTETDYVSVVDDSTHGHSLLIAPANESAFWRRLTRINPTSDAAIEVHLDVGTGCVTGDANGRQICALISDGERTLAWGTIDGPGNEHTLVGLMDASTGHFIGTPAIWSNTIGVKYTPGMGTIRLVKSGRNAVQLFLQSWQGGTNTTGFILIAQADYSSFPTTTDWLASAAANSLYTAFIPSIREMAWGTIDYNRSLTYHVKWVDWYVRDSTDYWNLHSTGSTSNPGHLADASTPFLSGDVDKLIRITDFSALNASNGNSLGIWRILSRTDSGHVTLIGETTPRGMFSIENLSQLRIRGGYPEFVWPDHLGHSVEILDGPNAGTYAIQAIVDPATGLAFQSGLTHVSDWTSSAAQIAKFRSHIVLLDGDFELTTDECTWRLVPNFPTDAGVVYEMIDAGTDSSGHLTFRAATPFPAGTLMSVHASKVLSAYVYDPKDPDVLVSGSGPSAVYKAYPFYLYDAFGYLRQVMDIVRAAGIRADFDNLILDAAGRHILEG